MKYKRNWAWECQADVFFTDGSSVVADVQTDNKGQLTWFRLPGHSETYEPTEKVLWRLGIASIHFTTPVKLEAPECPTIYSNDNFRRSALIFLDRFFGLRESERLLREACDRILN